MPPNLACARRRLSVLFGVALNHDQPDKIFEYQCHAVHRPPCPAQASVGNLQVGTARRLPRRRCLRAGASAVVQSGPPRERSAGETRQPADMTATRANEEANPAARRHTTHALRQASATENSQAASVLPAGRRRCNLTDTISSETSYTTSVSTPG